MHCEKQLEAIKALKPENRILHLDSSGKFCKITKDMNDQYQQLMNYVFLLKDVSDFEKPATIINEVITSKQDTCRISEMFLLYKHNYRKLFDTALVFRLIVLDLSWASIHAILEVLNLETVEQYAYRIFNYASKSNDEELSKQKSYLSSCVSHTMHRFTRGLKRQVKFINSELRTFAVCCFSLLVNSTDLDSTKQIFSLMCKVFKSNYTDETVTQAIESLQALIQLRPEDSTEIKKVIQEIHENIEVNENEESVFEQEFEDEWYTETQHRHTIKAASPFTKLYAEIEQNVVITDTENVNPLCNQDFINFLQANFMPYIFIWAGFVYRQIKEANITRLSQGVIEKCFATKRRTIPKPIVPARHIQASLKDALADCAINRKINDLEEKSNQKGI